MSRWQKVREHIWPDEHGDPVLRHTKCLTPRGVAFPWMHREDFGNGNVRWFNGDGKDQGIPHPLIYRRDLFEQASCDEHAYICEGEADVDAGLDAGLLAVTAGAAGAFGREHARLFKGWLGRVTIVRDRDLAGAAGALKAHDALISVGLPESRMRVCRGRSVGEGGDLRDHLARYPVERLATEHVEALRAYVQRASAVTTPATNAGRTGGSGDLVRDSDGFLLNPHTGFIVSGPPMPKPKATT